MHEKDDHEYIISTFLDFNIIKENSTFPLFVLLSIFLINQKMNDNLMTKWQLTLYPIYFIIIFGFIKAFLKIIYSENEKMNIKFLINSNNIDRIILISNFFSMVNNAIGFLVFYYLGEFLDKRQDNFLYSTIYMISALCISQIIYSTFRKTKLFEIKKHATGESSNNLLAFISSMTGPLLTYLSNMMIVCNSSTGVCSQIYMSTITSLLGAFGVSISDLSDYLFPVTIVLLCISLFSLYIKKKKFNHPPFLLGVFSCLLIVISHVLEDTWGYYLIYPGNILMVAAAIWNARMNKFSGLPRFSK